jgi:hypothetical protein
MAPLLLGSAIFITWHWTREIEIYFSCHVKTYQPTTDIFSNVLVRAILSGAIKVNRKFNKFSQEKYLFYYTPV